MFSFRTDPRFPSDHQITLHFEKTAQAADGAGFLFQSPLVKIEPVTSIAKYDSLENFDDGKFFWGDELLVEFLF